MALEYNLKDWLVIDESFEKNGKRGLMIMDFDTKEEAEKFMAEENNPNYILLEPKAR